MKTIRTLLTTILLVTALSLLVATGGCIFGGEDEAEAPAPVDSTATSTPTQTTLTTVPVVMDELSTFESKDPFRQQALPPATSGSTTTTGGGGSSTTSTTGGGTTTTTNPSGVTTPVHSLKVLSIDVVNGVPVVTFEVDGVVYEDKKEGDVVSTSWGQIEVVEIDAEEQVVVLLHGSESRTLAVGQEFLK